MDFVSGVIMTDTNFEILAILDYHFKLASRVVEAVRQIREVKRKETIA